MGGTFDISQLCLMWMFENDANHKMSIKIYCQVLWWLKFSVQLTCWKLRNLI